MLIILPKIFLQILASSTRNITFQFDQEEFPALIWIRFVIWRIINYVFQFRLSPRRLQRWTYMSPELRPLPSFLFYKFQLSNADQLQLLFVLPLRCSAIMKSFILPVISTLNLFGVNSLSVWISQPQRQCFSYHIYSPWMLLILASSFIKSTEHIASCESQGLSDTQVIFRLVWNLIRATN